MLCEDVMLSDEVASARVQRSSEERAQNKVGESFATEVLDNEYIEYDLCGDVERMYQSEWQFVDHHRPQCVEEDLERAEECFARD